MRRAARLTCSSTRRPLWPCSPSWAATRPYGRPPASSTASPPTPTSFASRRGGPLGMRPGQLLRLLAAPPRARCFTDFPFPGATCGAVQLAPLTRSPHVTGEWHHAELRADLLLQRRHYQPHDQQLPGLGLHQRLRGRPAGHLGAGEHPGHQLAFLHRFLRAGERAARPRLRAGPSRALEGCDALVKLIE